MYPARGASIQSIGLLFIYLFKIYLPPTLPWGYSGWFTAIQWEKNHKKCKCNNNKDKNNKNKQCKYNMKLKKMGEEEAGGEGGQVISPVDLPVIYSLIGFPDLPDRSLGPCRRIGGWGQTMLNHVVLPHFTSLHLIKSNQLLAWASK